MRSVDASTRAVLIETLFDFFYPVHYKVGAILESLLSRGLTRKQFAVIWTIHSIGDKSGSLPRKRLEVELFNSLELASPTISKVLRELSTDPLGLLTVVTSKDSAREKVVRLTARGLRFVEDSNREAIKHFSKLVEGMNEEIMRGGVSYLSEIAKRFDHEVPIHRSR